MLRSLSGFLPHWLCISSPSREVSMNTRCSMVVLGVLALVAQASLARADGTITGLTLNLPAIKTCAVETITVNGTGQCGNVDVDFGDSHKLINLSLGHPISFPAVYHHAYAKLGTYTVRALPRPVQQMPRCGQRYSAGGCRPLDHDDVSLLASHAWRRGYAGGGKFRQSARKGAAPS
jgi:hypothetical protein